MIFKGINRCVFTGDSVSIGGCDQEFEIQEMAKAMDHVLTLPADTKIFCSREHALTNLKFCRRVETENSETIDKFFNRYEDLINCGEYPVPSILSEERTYNVFMRFKTKELQ